MLVKVVNVGSGNSSSVRLVSGSQRGVRLQGKAARELTRGLVAVVEPGECLDEHFCVRPGYYDVEAGEGVIRFRRVDAVEPGREAPIAFLIDGDEFIEGKGEVIADFIIEHEDDGTAESWLLLAAWPGELVLRQGDDFLYYLVEADWLCCIGSLSVYVPAG